MTLILSPFTYRALTFAWEAHKNQRRKYSHGPYIDHPIAVADLVRTVPHDEAMIAAAYLHDVVEDCGVPLIALEQEFGRDVAELVEQLSDISQPADGNRLARKAKDREHTRLASPRAKTIKLADLIDNTDSIVYYDPGFAKVYMYEKRLLLAHLTEGDPILFAQATKLVEAYFTDYE
jgi:(p)ppGpp synthase/HD superfamily hydrolase